MATRIYLSLADARRGTDQKVPVIKRRYGNDLKIEENYILLNFKKDGIPPVLRSRYNPDKKVDYRSIRAPIHPEPGSEADPSFSDPSKNRKKEPSGQKDDKNKRKGQTVKSQDIKIKKPKVPKVPLNGFNPVEFATKPKVGEIPSPTKLNQLMGIKKRAQLDFKIPKKVECSKKLDLDLNDVKIYDPLTEILGPQKPRKPVAKPSSGVINQTPCSPVRSPLCFTPPLENQPEIRFSDVIKTGLSKNQSEDLSTPDLDEDDFDTDFDGVDQIMYGDTRPKVTEPPVDNRDAQKPPLPPDSSIDTCKNKPQAASPGIHDENSNHDSAASPDNNSIPSDDDTPDHNMPVVKKPEYASLNCDDELDFDDDEDDDDDDGGRKRNWKKNEKRPETKKPTEKSSLKSSVSGYKEAFRNNFVPAVDRTVHPAISSSVNNNSASRPLIPREVDPEEEERKLKRAQRFSNPPPTVAKKIKPSDPKEKIVALVSAPIPPKPVPSKSRENLRKKQMTAADLNLPRDLFIQQTASSFDPFSQQNASSSSFDPEFDDFMSGYQEGSNDNNSLFGPPVIYDQTEEEARLFPVAPAKLPVAPPPVPMVIKENPKVPLPPVMGEVSRLDPRLRNQSASASVASAPPVLPPHAASSVKLDPYTEILNTVFATSIPENANEPFQDCILPAVFHTIEVSKSVANYSSKYDVLIEIPLDPVEGSEPSDPRIRQPDDATQDIHEMTSILDDFEDIETDTPSLMDEMTAGVPEETPNRPKVPQKIKSKVVTKGVLEMIEDLKRAKEQNPPVKKKISDRLKEAKSHQTDSNGFMDHNEEMPGYVSRISDGQPDTSREKKKIERTILNDVIKGSSGVELKSGKIKKKKKVIRIMSNGPIENNNNILEPLFTNGHMAVSPDGLSLDTKERAVSKMNGQIEKEI